MKKKKILIVKIILIVFAAILILPFITLGISRGIVYISVNTKNGIDEALYIPINDQNQYITIRGNDIANPVILWLHGGPASPDGFLSYEYSRYLTDDYTFVTWDQRGCGRTYFKNENLDPNNDTVSFEQSLSDLDCLVEYLKERFDQEKIILVGHSYGTMLGSAYSINHPNNIEIYIGVGQHVTMDSDFYAYEDARKIAVASGDDTSLMDDAYQAVLDNRTMSNFLDLESYIKPYHHQDKRANTLWSGFKSPYMGIDDLKWYFKQLGSMEDFIQLNQKLFDYVLSCNVTEFGLDYQMPVGFISGSQDWITPVKYSQDYYQLISAPQKTFELIDGCGHTPQLDDTQTFATVLKSMINNFQ